MLGDDRRPLTYCGQKMVLTLGSTFINGFFVRRRLTVKRPIPVLAWVLMAGSACPQIPDDLAALYRYDPATPLNIEQK
jgi:hypothetical protein